MVLNKPMGLAVQGGSGTTRHLDGMLGVIRTKDGQRPRLVHRLDKDTAGCLLIAKSRFAAAALAKTFRSRSARKIYWALVPGVPKPKQGRISTYLAKEQREDDSVMRVAQHGEEGASHAVTYYAVVETAANRLAWLSLKPVTGRTHQLRVQLAHIGHPIVGDPKYFDIENWHLPGGMQNKLHLLARRIVVPHPRGGTIDATAPLPPHMEQSWNLLGFDGSRYDPIEDAPEGLIRVSTDLKRPCCVPICRRRQVARALQELDEGHAKTLDDPCSAAAFCRRAGPFPSPPRAAMSFRSRSWRPSPANAARAGRRLRPSRSLPHRRRKPSRPASAQKRRRRVRSAAAPRRPRPFRSIARR